MTTQEQKMADALWEKYRLPAPAVEEMTIHTFRAAIKEAMQAQRKRDAEICRKSQAGDSRKESRRDTADRCAAAIEREPIA